MTGTVRRTIGVIGGTGAEGRGLAARWAAAGHRIVIGSRDEGRALEAAEAISGLFAGNPDAARPTGASNLDAAMSGDVVVLSVPYGGQLQVLTEIREACAGKVLISVVVPLRPPRVAQVHLPEAGSAAAEAQAVLGPSVRVVAAFHNVAASRLQDLDADIACDVLVCGDDESGKSVALDLVADAGARGFDAGPLVNAVVPEGLTSVLISLNRRYGSRAAGVRITNVSED